MGQQEEEDKRGPVKRYILGKIVTLEEFGCYTFLLPGRKKVLFRPELICKSVSELPQDKARGEFEQEEKRIAIVTFPDPKNITPEADYKFFSWLI